MPEAGPSDQSDPREKALTKLDRALQRGSAELRWALENTRFSELRAALPEVRALRPHEVEALLDLCLEEPDVSPDLLRVIEYLATLISTNSSRGRRAIRSDPVRATPRLREVCESFTNYDPAEVQRHLDALSTTIAELERADALDPIMRRMRGYKETFGQLLLVPTLLRKAVEYNVAVSVRLHSMLEAERALADLDLEALSLSETPEPEEDAAAEEDETPEQIAEDELAQPETASPMEEIADALTQLIRGAAHPGGPAGRMAERLDRSVLNSDEQQLFLSETEDAETEVLRKLIVTGLLVRSWEQTEPLLAELGIVAESVERHQVPELDRRVQELIAERLRRNDYAEAKLLSQIRTKFLHGTLENQAAARAREFAARVPVEERAESTAPPVEAQASSRPRPPRPHGAPRGRSKLRMVGTVAICIAIAGVGAVAALKLNPPKDLRSTHRLSSNTLLGISSYIDSAYRDGLGNGVNVLGTLVPWWTDLSPSDQREEAQRIVTELRSRGVEQIMLFDKGRALRVHAIGGRLLVPVPEPPNPPNRPERPR
jgi:hypothetical protein